MPFRMLMTSAVGQRRTKALKCLTAMGTRQKKRWRSRFTGPLRLRTSSVTCGPVSLIVLSFAADNMPMDCADWKMPMNCACWDMPHPHSCLRAQALHTRCHVNGKQANMHPLLQPTGFQLPAADSRLADSVACTFCSHRRSPCMLAACKIGCGSPRVSISGTHSTHNHRVCLQI